MISLATRLRKCGAPRCPYCHDQLSSAEAETTCGECSTRHHAECIRELGRCATYGCSESLIVPLVPVNERVRDEIRERIRQAMGHYTDHAASMSDRPRSAVGREQRHDSPGFKLADFAAKNPEGMVAVLICLPIAVLALLGLLFQVFSTYYA
ncbi:MAG: hypothetical protein JKY65_01410 [Planctomycetes bacterium]|nr:hypothetical protein [Planctomycetota bacterium]